MQCLSKLIYFNILGWKIVGNKNISKNTIKKSVIIVAPHTSWHDFYIGLLLRSIINVKTQFLGKKELFIFPFGWFFRILGGYPIDRENKLGMVKQVANMFVEKNEFRITLSPEGTRKKVAVWRTGFYYIAKQVQVPIIMIAFDFKNKEARISKPFFTTNDKQADFNFIHQFYKEVQGKIPEFS